MFGGNKRRRTFSILGLQATFGRIQFIQNHFHPKRENFIQNHLHPMTIFIQNQFHPKTFSSKTNLIPKRFRCENNSKQDDGVVAKKQYCPCLCESVAGRRPATPSHNHGLCPPFGFQHEGLTISSTFIQTRFHPMTLSSKNGFIQKITCGTINIVRVCVKASPAERGRRLRTNTACARV